MGLSFALILPISIGCLCENLLLMTYMYFVNFILIAVDAVVIVFVYSQIYVVIRQYDNLRRHMVNAEMALDTTCNNHLSAPNPNDDLSGHRSSESGKSNKRNSGASGGCPRNIPACSANVPYGCMRLPSCQQSSMRSGALNDTTHKASTRLSSINGKNVQNGVNLAVPRPESRRLIHEADQIQVDNPMPKNRVAIAGFQNPDRLRISERLHNDNRPEDKSKKVIRIKKNIKRETKTTRVCIIVSSIFIIFCLPSAVFQVVWQIMDDDYFGMEGPFFPLLKLFYTLSTFNAIANPIIYSISSPRFQQDIKRIFSDIPAKLSKIIRRLPGMS